MSRQYWQETISWATSDGTAVTNTTTETIIMPTLTIAANFLQDGRLLRASAYGRYSNVVTAVPTLTFALRWGGVAGTVIAQSPAITLSPTAITSAPWDLQVAIQVRGNGSSGSVFAFGQGHIYTGVAPKVNTTTGETSAADIGVGFSINSTGTTVPAAVTVDLTADTALALTVKWSAANASNSAQGHLFFLEALN